MQKKRFFFEDFFAHWKSLRNIAPSRHSVGQAFRRSIGRTNDASRVTRGSCVAFVRDELNFLDPIVSKSMNTFKKTKILLLLLTALAGMAKAQQYQPYKSGAIAYHGYDFPVVPGTEAWKGISHGQRIASLQLPADTLRGISTSRLLETCLYYPFNIDIFAFDEQLHSFGRVKEQFNGYAELYQRADFVQQLMGLYSSRDVSFVNRIATDREKGRYAFDYHFLEFMLSDAASMASETQARQMVAMLMGKKEQKTQCGVYGSTNRVAIGLAIGRCLQQLGILSDYQGTTLPTFLQSGKLADSNDLNSIYNKANNTINQ